MWSKLRKIYFKTQYWFEHEAPYLHKVFASGVKNLWRWFPIIWKDRDWDDHFIWILLEKKLINQAKYIGGRGIHLDAHRDAERMMTCVRLIQKIREEYYNMEHSDYQKSEFHFDDVPDRDDVKQLRIEEIWENFDEYFKKYPLIYKKVLKNNIPSKYRSDKYRIALYMARENHRRAKSLLFKMLNEHIESWWD